MRITARSPAAVALLAAAVWAPAAFAAPRGKAAGPQPGEVESRRRDEIEAAQRQDIAESLKKHFNIDVDWRTTSFDRLVDIRVRAAKAAELQESLGVSVDWHQYSWIELEALRRTLLSFEHYRGEHREPPVAGAAAPVPVPPPSGAASDALVRPTFKARPTAQTGRTGDPDGIIRPTFGGRPAGPVAAGDPDGVIRPTFAGRPRWSAGDADPDGLIAPTFAPFRRVSAVFDADGLIDPIRDPQRVPSLPR